MSVVRIHKKLESETLHLPELKDLIGRTVEIIVIADESAKAAGAVTPETADWQTAFRAAQELRDSDYDFDAWRQQRDCDRNQGNVPLP